MPVPERKKSADGTFLAEDWHLRKQMPDKRNAKRFIQ